MRHLISQCPDYDSWCDRVHAGFFQVASTTDGRGPREGQFAMKDLSESGEPGKYGVGFPNFLGKVEDPEARKTKLAAELANGRLAMETLSLKMRCALILFCPRKKLFVFSVKQFHVYFCHG